MKKLRKISREYYLRQIMACWMILSMAVVMPVRIAMAVPPVLEHGPEGGVFIHGTGGIVQEVNRVTNVTVGGMESIINWNSLDTIGGEQLNFMQDGVTGAAVLNRVTSGVGTEFLGHLSGEGMQIFMVNPAGIVFGGGSTVNVGALIASSLNLSDDDFRSGLDSGTFNFTGGAIEGTGNVTNEGTINAAFIALIGKHAINTGAINGDYVIMAAGDTVTISEVGSAVGVEVTVTLPSDPDLDTGEYLVDHYGAGRIEAQHVIFAAGDIWSSAYVGAEGEGSASVKMDAKGYIEIDDKIEVYAGAGSAAVATVDILAVEDIDMEGEVKVKAENFSGNSEDDAKATITINAGGNVEIVKKALKADAITGVNGDLQTGSGDAIATIDIDAGGSASLYKVDAKTTAKATDSGDATAVININAADGDVLIEKDMPDTLKATATADGAGNALADIDVIASGSVTLDDKVEAKATAKNGAGNAVVDILIDAGLSVTESRDIKADAKSQNGSGSATSIITVNAGDGVESNKKIEAKAKVENPAEDATNSAIATVDINNSGEGSDVYVNDVIADAQNDGAGDAAATVDIYSAANIEVEDHDGDTVKATANAFGGGGNADATISIDAVGDVYINDKLEASSHAAEGAGNATSIVGIHAGNNIEIDDDIKAKGAHTNDNSGDATANIIIKADTGYVEIDSKLETDAHANDNSGNAATTIDISAGTYVDLTGDKIKAKAHANDNAGNATVDVIIKAADGSVTIKSDIEAIADAGENAGDATATIDIDASEMVKVKYADVTAEAKTKTEVKPDPDMLDDEEDTVIDVTVSGRSATASVDIDATNGDVKVYNSSVEAIAINEVKVNFDDVNIEADELTVNLTVENFTTNADVTINAGEKVKVEAEWDTALVEADAHHEFSIDGYWGGGESAVVNLTANNIANDAGVTITSGDGDVKVLGNSGYARVGAFAYNQAWDDATNVDLELSVDNLDNTAAIDITSENDVRVIADNWEGYGEAYIIAEAFNEREMGEFTDPSDALLTNSENTASVDIIAGNEVKVMAFDGSVAGIGAGADNGTDNTASVDVDASGNVLVHAVDADASIEAWATLGVDNLATVDIAAVGGDVKVIDIGQGGDRTAKIEALTEDAGNSNTSEVQIDATAVEVIEEVEPGVFESHMEGGDVEVMARDGGHAVISAKAESEGSGDATATVDIDASGNVTVGADSEIMAETEVDNNGGPDGSSSSAKALVEIDAINVIVQEGGEIYADADLDNRDNRNDGSVPSTYTGNADADVTITASGVVVVDGLVKAEADIYNRGGWDENPEDDPPIENFPGDLYQGNSYANVTIDNLGGGLGLGVTVGPDGKIVADSAFINWDYPDPLYEDNVYSGIAFAGIDIETCGDVVVNGLISSVAFIDPIGTYDVDPTNDDYSQTMTADVIIKAYGDVIVNSEHEEEENGAIGIGFDLAQFNGNGGSNGQIEALASNGYENSADIILLAKSDVIVNDGAFFGGEILLTSGGDGPGGSDFEVLAEASGGFTNTAHIGIATRDGVDEGDVVIGGQIAARAFDADDFGDEPKQYEPGKEPTNTSSVEISAARDVIVEGGFALLGQDDGPYTIFSEQGGQILASASRGHFNAADVDVLAGRDIIVEGAEVDVIVGPPGDGPAKTSGGGDSYAGGQIIARTHDGEENTSGVDLYAHNDVVVDGMVKAGAQNGEIDTATVKVKALGEIAGSGEIYANGGKDGSIIFDSPSIVFNGKADYVEGDLDFPVIDFAWANWNWCVECEDVPALPADPRPQFELPMIEGCPQLVQAAAVELGITPETIQVSIGNGLALTATIQACQACAKLVSAAAILRDEDGSRMAAMVQMFNDLAPAAAPFTPATAASIATAFEGAAEGSQYASAMEYIDAFAQYVAVLDIELGSPVGDSVAYVMEKHGAGVMGSGNANIAAFVAARLEAIGG